MDTNNQPLDMRQLFGFSEVVGEVNMAAPALASRLGAKVGAAEAASFIWRNNPNQICVRQ